MFKWFKGQRVTSIILAIFLALSFALYFPAVAQAEDSAPPASVLSPLYLNNTFGGDARTERVFSWETATGYTNATVDIVESGMPFTPENITTFSGATGSVPSIYTPRNAQRVSLAGLTPGETYDYRLGDITTDAKTGAVTQYYSPVYHFTTEPAANDPFTFLHFADSQSDPSAYTKYWGNTVAKALANVPNAAFMIDTGDMTDPLAPASIDAATTSHWDAFFAAVGSDFSGPAFLPVLGNHEGSSAGPVSFYQSVFPVDSENGYPLNYAYTYGNALFFELNSNYTSAADLQKQGDWIKSVAAQEGAGKFIIAAFHKGPYGELHSGDADVISIKNSLVPALEAAGVNLVLQGHDHQYYRSYPIKNGAPNTSAAGDVVSTADDGVIFMCTGTSGEKTYAMYKEPWINKYWDPTTQGGGVTQDTYSAITVDSNSISVNVYNTGGQMIDSYKILAPNKLALDKKGTQAFPTANAGYAPQTPMAVGVTNNGDQPTGTLSVALSGAGAADFTLSTASMGSLAAGASSGFTVVPNSGLALGTYTATVTVSGDNGLSNSFNVSFTVNQYGISLDKASAYAFPAAIAGYAAIAPVTAKITNTGNLPTGTLTIAKSGANTGSFTVSVASIASIAAGGSANFTFYPNTGLAAGTYAATITASNAANGISSSFDISFTVNPKTYGISLDKADTQAFPTVNAGYAAQTPLTVGVANTGNQATGALTVALSGANAGSFTLSAASVASIAANGTDKFTVVPKTGLAVGTYTATVKVSGSNGILASFDVSFTVNQYKITLDKTGTQTFPAANIGYTAVTPLAVSVTNTGNLPTGTLTVASTGAAAGSFKLSAASIESIAPGGTAELTVVPNAGLADGAYAATVTVSGDNGLTASFNVSFTVYTPVAVTARTIASGSYHNVYLKPDGTVWAWGSNSAGQIGDGTVTNRSLPVQVSGLANIASVEAGYYHSLALKSDGTVWAWGYNNAGQLGDGTVADRHTPIQVSGLTNAVDIAGGLYHSAALKSDGTVWDWGYNAYGQLGDNTTAYRYSPVQVQGLTGVSRIAAGYYHTIALKPDGTVWDWGNNASGQLGDGTVTNRYTPVQVQGLTGVIAIAAGDSHTVALKSDGTVWAWGYNVYGQLGDGTVTNRNIPVQVKGLTDVVAISACNLTTIALKSDGTVWAWGYNGYGQLGDGTATVRYTPVQVQGLAGAVAVSAGFYHTEAVKSDGTIWDWGYNGYGQLGNNTVTSSMAPVLVGFDYSVSVTGVTLNKTTDALNVGDTDTLAATITPAGATNKNVTWTSGNTSVATVDSSGKVTAIAAGSAVITATTASGAKTAACTVTVSYIPVAGVTLNKTADALNVGDTDTLVAAVTPTGASNKTVAWTSGNPSVATVDSSGKVTAIAAGSAVITATTADGAKTAACTVTVSIVPVTGVTLNKTTDALNVGDTDTLVATVAPAGASDKTVAWTSGNPSVATVDSSGKVTGVAAGSAAITVTTADGAKTAACTVTVSNISVTGVTLNKTTDTLNIGGTDTLVATVTPTGASNKNVAWSSSDTSVAAVDSSGKVTAIAGGSATITVTTADGAKTAACVVTVSSVSKTIASGSYHNIYLKPDGTVWAWGSNSAGQIGDGTVTNRSVPVRVSGLSGVSAVAAGYYHSLALKSDGTVWAWGYNNAGQIGDGTVTSRSVPVQVGGMSNVTDIAGGIYQSVALKSDGTVWDWGYNGYGQLGDNTTAYRYTPVQVQGLTGVSGIAAGYYHTIALKPDGTVWDWGNNASGQLGDGTVTNRYTPVQVRGLTGVIAIAAGDSHTVALKSDGTVWAWGYNGYGQLGDGTVTNRNIPVQVKGLTDVVAISACNMTTIALKSDGTVWGWGYNGYGQLGDGTATVRYTPVQVQGMAGAVAVSAGFYHTEAVKSDGAIWDWGYNGYGQLGNNTVTSSMVPVKVSFPAN